MITGYDDLLKVMKDLLLIPIWTILVYQALRAGVSQAEAIGKELSYKRDR